MRILRRFGLLAAVAAGAAVLAGPAFGARPGAGQLPFTLASTHFLVHYESDTQNTGNAITQTMAGDIAALAERAYTAELADGFAAPVSDGVLGGDGRIDIYVDDLTPLGSPLGVTIPDNPLAATSSTYIELDGAQPELAFAQHTIAHELFHAIQVSTWNAQLQSDAWLFEGSAEWMGYRTTGYDTTWGLELGPRDMALDCGDPLGTWQCDFDTYANNGYSRWSFFEYMWERYGAAFFNDVFARGAAGASSINAISGALGARGTTLADTYNAWAQTDLVGGYSIAALQGLPPSVIGKIATGTKSGTIGTFKVPVNHLSTRTIELDRGDGDASNVCYAATLSISVALPAGTLSKPVFLWNAKGSAAVPLTVSGSTAAASLPWDTCTYSSTAGFLAIPNASTNVNAADFAVTLSLTVDTKTPATQFAVPDPIFMPTPTVPVTSADVAPTLSLFGPEVLKLSSTETQLRLIVESTGQGSVQAQLGGTVLGKAALRGGNNDLRFTLPGNLLKALRRTASAANVLTLTPSSPTGVSGQPVTRTVQVQPAEAKVKAKAKLKVKAKARAVKRRK
jgi:hypothetical protein